MVLLEKSGILPHEKVDVLNINNGQRFSTYTIKAPRGSKKIQVNGAAARMVHQDDLVIIISYATMAEEKAKNFQPKIINLNLNNEII